MIKPSRGAVIQRTLSAVARRVRGIYWYTYGPDWHHPDTFARAPDRLDRVSRVAHMIGEAESVTYDADWAFPAQVAVVRPLTSAIFESSASWENGKWVYTALQHAHVPVDPLDEEYLMSEDLSRYKVIYVSGSHIRRDVATRLVSWVEQGGVLYTSGGGLARDEADRPLDILLPVLGLTKRDEVQLWSEVRRYGSTRLADYKAIAAPPSGASVLPQRVFRGSFDLAVGREVLHPVPGAEILATYRDGGVAAVRHTHGEGTAYTVGFFPGLEYAAGVLDTNTDMASDFRTDKRAYVAEIARAAGVTPPVDCTSPLVEAVLLKHAGTGAQAVLLMNWAYAKSKLVPAENVVLRVRGAGAVRRARSTWWRRALSVAEQDGDAVIRLQRVEDGDILLLE